MRVIAIFMVMLPVWSGRSGEVLHNGIVLPEVWPPRVASFARELPIDPPWLMHPPAIIPVDLGRQLFVDDFLIAENSLERTFHQPEWHPGNPILRPETPAEHHRNRNLPFAAPFSDGVWFDPVEKIFKMWYLAGTAVLTGYATSIDGVKWERPDLNLSRFGSNILNIEPVQRDSSTVWMDLEEPDPQRRYKMMYYRAGLIMRVSPDGLRWSESLGAPGGSGDRSTFYRDPFRRVWVYSIRGSEGEVGRCRFYGESERFGEPLWGSFRELPRWACADALDRVKDVPYAEKLPDLYNLDAVGYESLMLGLFVIHARVAEGARPKINYVTLGYSRDGFHWHRPDRRPFLDVSEDPKAWNYGNVQPAGGGCLVVGDRLFFHCSGRNSGRNPDDGTGGSTGLAFLRRDGFASLGSGEKGGTVTTRPLKFQGRHLFVNADVTKGELRAELLSEDGRVLPPFTRENSRPFTGDSTLTELTWNGAPDLSAHLGKPVRLRFHLKNGKLYSFWIAQDTRGASLGYLGAGGPGYTSHRDLEGRVVK